MISRDTRGTIDWPLVLLLLGAATYLYFNLFSPFRTPILLGGDQVYFWTYAERMLDGERIYRDFFQFTPPGTDLVYLGLFKLFGPSVWCSPPSKAAWQFQYTLFLQERSRSWLASLWHALDEFRIFPS